MKLLDRYLLRRYLTSLLLSVVGLWLISVIVDLIERIDTFIDFKATPLQILSYYFYHSPYWIILTLPIATLLGTLFALGNFARNREITAMKAAGISLHRIKAVLQIVTGTRRGTTVVELEGVGVKLNGHTGLRALHRDARLPVLNLEFVVILLLLDVVDLQVATFVSHV